MPARCLVAMDNIIQDFLKSLSSMQDGPGSDYVLTLGDERWNIHKTVAMAQSPVIRKAISCNFQASLIQVYKDLYCSANYTIGSTERSVRYGRQRDRAH